jgi:predicted PurR-regulated permease PerM
MTATPGPPPRQDLARLTFGVLLIIALLALTIWILRPFLGALVWATMIVVATWPIMRRLQTWLWGSRRWAVAAMTAILLLTLALPLAATVSTIVASAGTVIDSATRLQTLRIPAAPGWLADVPLVGAKAVETWNAVATSPVGDVVETATPYAATAVVWAAGTLQGVGLLLLQFLLTVAIAAGMYANGERLADALLLVGRRLAGGAGDEVVRQAAQAIRGVALGVLVTAMVQAALAGLGLAVAGIPFMWLLAAVAFVLCIAQLGPVLVLAPAVAWLYWQGATGMATGLLVWTVIVGGLDNVVRPILMTKGTDLPMLLMFAGVLGGLLGFGLIGVFVGPVILAVAYTLLGAWLADVPDAPPHGDSPS